MTNDLIYEQCFDLIHQICRSTKTKSDKIQQSQKPMSTIFKLNFSHSAS